MFAFSFKYGCYQTQKGEHAVLCRSPLQSSLSTRTRRERPGPRGPTQVFVRRPTSEHEQAVCFPDPRPRRHIGSDQHGENEAWFGQPDVDAKCVLCVHGRVPARSNKVAPAGVEPATCGNVKTWTLTTPLHQLKGAESVAKNVQKFDFSKSVPGLLL